MKTLIKMSFDPEVAKKIDTDSAIIYENIKFWCNKNKLNNRHFYDGKFWTYNSIKAFQKQFNYLSEKQIRIRLKKLEESGYISSGSYNKTSFDKTKWYADNSISLEEEFDLPKGSNGVDQDGDTIPYNKPYNKPYTFLKGENEKKISLDNYRDITNDSEKISTYKQFEEIWNQGRKKLLKVKHSNFKVSQAYQKNEVDRYIKEKYRIGDVKQAVAGLLKQQDCFPAMKSHPEHFLREQRLEKYLDAYKNKNFKLYCKNKRDKDVGML